MLHTLVHLGADAQVGVGKNVHGLHHAAMCAVLQRDDAVVHLIALYGRENVIKRGVGYQFHAVAETAESGLVAPGAFRPQVADAHVALQVERTAHNLPPDAQQAFFRKHSIIQLE